MKIAVLVLALLLAGCGRPEPYWTRDGATQVEFNRDSAGCRNQGRSIAGASPYVHWLTVYDDCMRSLGWEQDNG